MKIKLLFFIFPLFMFAQLNNNYVDIKTVPSETGIIVTKTTPFSVLNTAYDYYGMYNLLQSVNELKTAGLDFDSQKLEIAMRMTSYNETIKIGGIHTTFETINPEAISRNDVIVMGNNYKVRTNASNVFQKKTKTIITPLTTHKRGLQTSFYVDRTIFKNTTTTPISELQIDFGDGHGFKNVAFDTPIQISYPNAGKKIITFNLRLADGEEIQSTSTLFVSALPENTQTVTATIDPQLSIYDGADSFLGMGEYEVFLGAGNTDITKPIIVIDGFDPGDTRGINDIYNLLTYTDTNGATQNLADRIRAEENFDVIVLNLPQYLKLADNTLQLVSTLTDTNGDMIIDENDYPAGSTLIDGGADFIERNAMTLVQLINTINSQKVGNEENVIIGPSMGGLISRYALNYMESIPTLNHDTRLWISFDAPHLGANVPIGFQHLFNYLAYGLDVWVGDFSVESLRPIVDGMLKSPAARQMLTDHMESHLQSGQIAEFDDSVVLPQPHPYYGFFFNRLNNLTVSGYPENLRKVTMINGSGAGNPYLDKTNNPILPGRKVLDAFIEDVAFLTDAYLKVWYGPTSATTLEVSNIWIDAPFLCFCDINTDADSRTETFSNGIDAAMGGLFDLGALSGTFAGGDPTIDAFFMNLETDYFNFIPTISSMALKNQNDWYAIPNPNNGNNINETPFDAWHMPVANENHISLTPSNVDFAWNEIVTSTLSVPSNVQQNDIQVAQNPIKDILKLLVNTSIDELHISIYDLSGRIVLNKKITTVPSTLETPISLQAGMYILQLKHHNTIQTEKIIIQ